MYVARYSSGGPSTWHVVCMVLRASYGQSGTERGAGFYQAPDSYGQIYIPLIPPGTGLRYRLGWLLRPHYAVPGTDHTSVLPVEGTSMPASVEIEFTARLQTKGQVFNAPVFAYTPATQSPVLSYALSVVLN